MSYSYYAINADKYRMSALYYFSNAYRTHRGALLLSYDELNIYNEGKVNL